MATSGDLDLATSGDLDLATSGYFFMATDTQFVIFLCEVIFDGPTSMTSDSPTSRLDRPLARSPSIFPFPRDVFGGIVSVVDNSAIVCPVSMIAGWLTPRLKQHLSNEPLDQFGGVRRCTFRLIRGRYGFATNKSRCHESAQSVGAPGHSLSTRYRGCPTPIRTVRCRRIGGRSMSRECHKSERSDMDWAGR